MPGVIKFYWKNARGVFAKEKHHAYYFSPADRRNTIEAWKDLYPDRVLMIQISPNIDLRQFNGKNILK